MAKIPSLQRLLVEDFPDQAQWIQRLISPLNDFMENSIYALTRNLTFFDNMSSQTASLSVQASTTFSADTTLNSNTLTNLSTTLGLYATMPILGAGLPSSTKIASFANKAYILGNVTQNSNVITGIASTSGIIVGQPVIGSSIQPNTVVASVDSSSQISLSTAALNTVVNNSLYMPATAILTNSSSLTSFGVNYAAGGAFPVSFNCTLNGKPSHLWVTQCVDTSSSPVTLTSPVFCDWSYNTGSIVINNITGLNAPLVSGSPRTFNITVLAVFS